MVVQHGGANQLLVFGTEAGLRFGPLVRLIPGPLDSRRTIEERALRVEDGDTSSFGDVTQQFVDALLDGREPYTPPATPWR